MKLKDLLPLIRTGGLHDSVYKDCVNIKYDNKEKYIYDLKVGELADLGEREVIGISDYLPFTIWLENKEDCCL